MAAREGGRGSSGPLASTARWCSFGTEPERPYERPPLSKGYLLGKDTRDSVFVHSARLVRREER